MSVPLHEIYVSVRSLGYETLNTRVFLQAASDTLYEFILKPLPRQLREMVISSEMDAEIPSSLVEAYKRVEQKKGIFFTRTDINQLNPRDFQTLLNRVPTVNMNDRGITFQKCQSGIPSPLGGNPHEQAKVQVWIDGLRVSGRIQNESVGDILRSISPSSIEVMEVYNGIAKIPAEFLDDACAVIVLWTRRY